MMVRPLPMKNGRFVGLFTACLIILPQILALSMTSLTQTAGHKVAAFPIVLSRLSSSFFLSSFASSSNLLLFLLLLLLFLFLF